MQKGACLWGYTQKKSGRVRGRAVGSSTEASCGDGRPQVGQGAEMTVGIPGRSGPIAHGPPALGWRQ